VPCTTNALLSACPPTSPAVQGDGQREAAAVAGVREQRSRRGADPGDVQVGRRPEAGLHHPADPGGRWCRRKRVGHAASSLLHTPLYRPVLCGVQCRVRNTQRVCVVLCACCRLWTRFGKQRV